MARKNGVNKSQAIRELLHQNPKIKAQEAIDTLAKQGIDVASSLFYFTKGKVKGRRGRRKMNAARWDRSWAQASAGIL